MNCRKLSIVVLISLLFFLSACNVNNDDNRNVPYINNVELGKDFKDLKASIKMLTFRTDILESKLKDYIREFQKLYPNIEIEYEGLTNYESDTTIRLSSGSNWGDIMMIPHVDKSLVSEYFMPIGEVTEIEGTYNFINAYSYNGIAYGMPSTGNAYGILYNKRVFREAGITQLPKTPNEFLSALVSINEKTAAIPLYTNYAAGWPMSSWDAYIGTSATGNPKYMNQLLVHERTPFSNFGTPDHAYAVYKILYDAVASGLIEEDYTTTDEAASYAMINRGDIGCLVLGSWAYVQAYTAGVNGDDLGYMPFPISIGGKQFVSIGPDYSYGINVKSSYENKLASLIYVKWLTHQSGFAYSEGGIPIVKSDKLPSLYESFDGVELIEDTVALPGEETFFDDLNNESGLGLNSYGNAKVQEIVENAFNKEKSFDEIMSEWNDKWHAAQLKLKISSR